MTSRGLTSVRVNVLGTVFRLEAPDRRTAEVLRTQWSRCLVPDSTGDPAADTAVPVESEIAPQAPTFGYAIASQLTMLAIGELSGKSMMFHAAGLSDEAGRVVALVAPSGSGKTTAARALAGNGWGYVTDETVAVDPTDRVLHYPKPLSVVVDPASPGLKTQHSPDELGLGAAASDLTLTRIVVLDRMRDRHSPATTAWVPMLDGLLELMPQTSALSRLSQPLQWLCRLAERHGIARLTYSDAPTTGPILQDLLASPVPANDWAPLPRAPRPPSAGAYTQTEALDAVRIGDEALLLVDRTPVRLSPLGLTLWLRCAAGATADELLDSAVAAHGAHPQAAPLIARILDEMVDAGVLAHGA